MYLKVCLEVCLEVYLKNVRSTGWPQMHPVRVYSVPAGKKDKERGYSKQGEAGFGLEGFITSILLIFLKLFPP